MNQDFSRRVHPSGDIDYSTQANVELSKGIIPSFLRGLRIFPNLRGLFLSAAWISCGLAMLILYKKNGVLAVYKPYAFRHKFSSFAPSIAPTVMQGTAAPSYYTPKSPTFRPTRFPVVATTDDNFRHDDWLITDDFRFVSTNFSRDYFILIILTSVIYFIYLCDSFFYTKYNGVFTLVNGDDYVNRLIEGRPIIFESSECYHYETRHRNNKQHTAYQVKVLAHRITWNFDYQISRDVSRVPDLKDCPLTKLNTNLRWESAGQLTGEIFEMEKSKFQQAHLHCDSHHIFTSHIELAGLESNVIAYSNDRDVPFLIRYARCTYVLLTFIGLRWAFSVWLAGCCGEVNVNIVKSIQCDGSANRMHSGSVHVAYEHLPGPGGALNLQPQSYSNYNASAYPVSMGGAYPLATGAVPAGAAMNVPIGNAAGQAFPAGQLQL